MLCDSLSSSHLTLPCPPDAISERMWQVLSSAMQEKKCARLTLAERRAIVEIRETPRRAFRVTFGPK